MESESPIEDLRDCPRSTKTPIVILIRVVNLQEYVIAQDEVHHNEGKRMEDQP